MGVWVAGYLLKTDKSNSQFANRKTHNSMRWIRKTRQIPDAAIGAWGTRLTGMISYALALVGVIGRG